MRIDERVNAVLLVARGCEAMDRVPRANAGKVLREAVFFFWEQRDGSKFSDHRRRSVAFRERRGKRVYDHAIPLKVLVDRLFSTGVTATSVREMLASVEGVLITETEHRRLRGLGLQSAMPNDWDGSDRWARYRAAGIELCQ